MEDAAEEAHAIHVSGTGHVGATCVARALDTLGRHSKVQSIARTCQHYLELRAEVWTQQFFCLCSLCHYDPCTADGREDNGHMQGWLPDGQRDEGNQCLRISRADRGTNTTCKWPEMASPAQPQSILWEHLRTRLSPTATLTKRALARSGSNDYKGHGWMVYCDLNNHGRSMGNRRTDRGSNMYLQDHALHSDSGLWSKKKARVGVHTKKHLLPTLMCARNLQAAVTHGTTPTMHMRQRDVPLAVTVSSTGKVHLSADPMGPLAWKPNPVGHVPFFPGGPIGKISKCAAWEWIGWGREWKARELRARPNLHTNGNGLWTARGAQSALPVSASPKNKRLAPKPLQLAKTNVAR